MQLIIPAVTPLDFSRQVEYSCVISLSAAATSGVLKKNAKPIAATFLVHRRPFATSLLNSGIIVNLETSFPTSASVIGAFAIEIVVQSPSPASQSQPHIGGCAYQKPRPYDLLSVGHDGRTNIPLLEPGCFTPQVQEMG